MNKSQYLAVKVSYDTDSNYTPLKESNFKPNDSRNYTYKCHKMLEPKVGDMCIVITPHSGFQVVTITEVFPEDHKFNPKINYKWIVDKVGLELYNTIIKNEAK